MMTSDAGSGLTHAWFPVFIQGISVLILTFKSCQRVPAFALEINRSSGRWEVSRRKVTPKAPHSGRKRNLTLIVGGKTSVTFKCPEYETGMK